MPVRFESLRLHEVRIPFRFRYKHALADRRAASALIIEVRTACGHSGWGECIPRSYLTGETIDSVIEDITARWWPLARSLSLDTFDEFLSAVNPVYAQADSGRSTAAYSGLEIALADAAGKAFGKPVRGILRGNRSPRPENGLPDTIRYTAPLGGATLAKTKWFARFFRWLGFSEFKLKLGFDDDEARLAAVRAAIGPDANLRVDANAAWNMETAMQRAAMLGQHHVSSLEQPLPAGNIEALAQLRRDGVIPLMADEDLCTRADAEKLIAAGACDIFNIRLAKCGGFSGALAQISAARDAGLDCQLGVLVGETNLLAAAGQELLAALGPLRHHETSFPHLFLKRDIARGASAVCLRGRAARKPPRPGLGVEVRSESLNRATLRRIEA